MNNAVVTTNPLHTNLRSFKNPAYKKPTYTFVSEPDGLTTFRIDVYVEKPMTDEEEETEEQRKAREKAEHPLTAIISTPVVTQKDGHVKVSSGGLFSGFKPSFTLTSDFVASTGGQSVTLPAEFGRRVQAAMLTPTYLERTTELKSDDPPVQKIGGRSRSSRVKKQTRRTKGKRRKTIRKKL